MANPNEPDSSEFRITPGMDPYAAGGDESSDGVSESFFRNGTVGHILQRNYDQISHLEETEMKRIMKLYSEARHSMRDRLDSLPRGTFTAQRLAGALAQVDAGIYQMNKILSKEMTSSGKTFAETGIAQLLEEIKQFDREFTGAVVPISLNAVKVASDASNFLFNKYEVSVEAYGAGMRSLFASNLLQASIEELSMGEVVQQIGQYFNAEEWKISRLVRTEMMGVYSYGKFKGMQELQSDIPDLMKTLYHPMDKRTGEDSKWLNAHNPIVALDKPFTEDSTGKERTYMFPPNRPNDRAILTPIRRSWYMPPI